jgi:integrase
MKSIAGLWIDHRKAVIVFITDKKIEKKTITSNGEKWYQADHNLGGPRMLLGHANIQTTQIYINLLMTDLKDTIKNFTAF